ncbi:MAG: phasin family protein [Candidatus Omnitrophica bacterium]|nr:phasin family protein [Candidatus Omnitrophota bacterium]
MDKGLKEVVDRFVLASLGIATLAKEKTEKLVAELSKKGEIPKEKVNSLVDNLVKEGKTAKSELGKFVEKTVKNTLDKIGIATKKDIEELKKKIKK